MGGRGQQTPKSRVAVCRGFARSSNLGCAMLRSNRPRPAHTSRIAPRSAVRKDGALVAGGQRPRRGSVQRQRAAAAAASARALGGAQWCDGGRGGVDTTCHWQHLPRCGSVLAEASGRCCAPPPRRQERLQGTRLNILENRSGRNPVSSRACLCTGESGCAVIMHRTRTACHS
jgi:hypothetical protein